MEMFAPNVCTPRCNQACLTLDTTVGFQTQSSHVSNTWQNMEPVPYERQVGSPLPDDVLAATLICWTRPLEHFSKTSGRMRALGDTIVEYFRSKLILRGTSSSSDRAPMDVGTKKNKGKEGGPWSKKGKAREKAKERNFRATAGTLQKDKGRR